MGLPVASLFSLETKPTFLELALYGGIPVVLGIVLFSIALRVEDSGGSTKLKWFSLIPFLIGAILNFKFLNAVINDPAYMASNWPGWPREGRKDVIFHWATFIAPILTGLICAIWGVIHARNASEQY